jgi:hypothetical protein
MQFPLDGGNANLCKWRRIQTVSGGDNDLLIFDAVGDRFKVFLWGLKLSEWIDKNAGIIGLSGLHKRPFLFSE